MTRAIDGSSHLVYKMTANPASGNALSQNPGRYSATEPLAAASYNVHTQCSPCDMEMSRDDVVSENNPGHRLPRLELTAPVWIDRIDATL